MSKLNNNISRTILIIVTTAFVMSLIYGYIIKQKEKRWQNAINSKESFEVFDYKTLPFDSIYHKKDTSFYNKKNSLVVHSVKDK